MYKRITEIDGNPLPNKFKTDYLLKRMLGAYSLRKPPVIWRENLVCVIVNMAFEEARYVSNQLELDLLSYDNGKTKNWLILPDAKKYID